MTLLPLFGLIYFTVCGGSFGIEPLVGWSGPGLALLLVFLTPIIFSIPNMLMVRELNSMMPAEGGYYHWIKQAFGAFAGFLAGWMNWVVSWVDVAIYPVLAAYYLGYFIPPLWEGMNVGGVELSASFLSWVVAAILIWLITWLQVRGARLAGLTTAWMTAVMLAPLVLLTIVGFINWFRSGTTISLPMLPEGESLIGAFSVCLFVVMWNYMGWELPTAAGDEIVNPRKTYPRAMLLVLVAAILTLVANGVRFDYFYAAQQVRSPETLWHPDRAGIHTLQAVRPQEITIAQTLKASGYSTGQFGKWHLGDSETHPIRMGFDRTISSGKYYDNGAIGCRTVGCLEWSARFPKPIRTSLPAVQMDMYPTALAAARV